MKKRILNLRFVLLVGMTIFLAQNVSIKNVWAANSTGGFAYTTGRATTVSAGQYHSVGLKADGTLIGTGNSTYGQLGFGGWTNIVSVAAGGYSTLGLKIDGTVVGTGNNNQGQLNVWSWTNIRGIAMNFIHSLGVKADGTVVAAGDNIYGQMAVSGWTNIVAIAAGGYHSVGLKSDGTVVAVGRNSEGQTNVSTWTNIVAIDAGTFQTVGLKADGTVVYAGMAGSGIDCTTWTNVVAISAGHTNTLGIISSGGVLSAGDNYYGQSNVTSWGPAAELSSGYIHSIGLKTNGTVVGTGDNSEYQCNTSTWTLNITPSITVTIPINGQYRSAQTSYNTITISGTVRETNTGQILKVYYRIDGSPGQTGTQIGSNITANGTDQAYSGAVSAASLSEGAHYLYFWVQDSVGGRSVETNRTFIMDKTAPASPTLNLSTSNWTNNNVTFTVTPGTDAASGVLNSQYRINSGVWTTCSAMVTVNTEGSNLVEIKTVDNVGNTSSIVSGYARVDKTAPTLPTVNLNPAEWTSGSVNVTITAGTDPLSGVNKTEYRASADGNWTLYSSGFTIYTVGITTMYAKTTDNAGNTSESMALVKIKTDIMGPLVTLFIANGATYITSSSTTLQITAVDNLTPISSLTMRFSNDNSAWSSWEAFSPSKPWIVMSGDALKTVYVQVKDTDSNITSASDVVYLSSATPSNTSSSSSSGTLNGGYYYIKDNEVTISMTNSGATTIRYSLSEAVWSEWENAVSAKTLQLPSGDGKKKIQFQLKNSNEKPSSVYTISFVLDTAAPVFNLSTLNGATATSSGNITLEISELLDNVFITSFKYSINGGAQNPLPVNNQIAITGLTTGLQTIRIRIYDQAGNYSEKSVKVWRL